MSKVLIVDDEKEFVTFLSNYLRRKYSHVYTSTTGKQALRVFRQEQPDVVLLDINIPDINGFIILKRMLAIAPHTNVIIITCKEDSDSIEKADSFGAVGYITKPFELKQIWRAIASFS